MKIFSNIDKKVLVTLFILILALILVGFFVYKQIANPLPVELKSGDVEFQSETGSGTLTVCTYECGNGLCQIDDPVCLDDSLSCICPETPENCPQDCQ